MTKINIPQLREWCRMDPAPNVPNLNIASSELLALVEAVEAARRLVDDLRACEDCIGEEHVEEMQDALAKFEFERTMAESQGAQP